MSGSAFFDTNVPLYLLSGSATKAATAERLLRRGGSISVQVLNELVDVSRRKFKASWETVDTWLELLKSLCSVEPLTLQVHDRAVVIARRHQIRIYDATILASAIECGATTLYSEDFQSGQAFQSLTVRNPFDAP